MVEELNKVDDGRKIYMYISFLEIYNEKIYDLLNS